MAILMLVIIAVVIIGFVALDLKKRLQAKKQTERADAEDLDDNGADKQKDSPQGFQDWAKKRLTSREKALKNWLMTFSPEEAEAFTKQLNTFCATVNIELIWLIDEQLDKNSELKKTAKKVVVSYCQACFQAAQAQSDFQAWGAYQRMIENPSSKAHRALSKKLFVELVKQDMAPTIPPNLFLAAEEEQQAYIMEAIQQAAEADRVKVHTIFKQIIELTQAENSKSESLITKLFKRVKRSEDEQAVDVPEEKQAAIAE